MHEAFAGQVMALLKALDSDWFAKEVQGFPGKTGPFDMARLNLWGGSVSIGHPFGATGVRLIAHAVNRLAHEKKQYAMIAACAAGGLGHAALVEAYPS